MIKFGHKLRTAFSKIAETKQRGQERQRIFMKVKEKLDEETSLVLNTRQKMHDEKKKLEQDKQNESENLKIAERERQKRIDEEFKAKQIIEAQNRVKNELMDRLYIERQIRAREVLQELQTRGIKKVGKDRVTFLEQEKDLDYDAIMDCYQAVLLREKTQAEVKKNKKFNDVEIWARALKEEEALKMK